jgi:hypothetical protein
MQNRLLKRVLSGTPKDTPKVLSPLLTKEEAAGYLRVSQRTFERMRARKDAPAFIRISRRVWYRICDLENFIEAHRGEDA